ncbi:hypothetical protein QE152_g11071 [Popillia japonica]|uniref:Integrase catalytic domain-containing protein n=1 Tax=Popillia japonica TaxID=7064 RepID=A0AAW1LT51_POPJA
MLKLIHEGHNGIEKSKARARQVCTLLAEDKSGNREPHESILETNEIYHKSGDRVVKQLKLLFSRFGIPNIVSCGNVPFGFEIPIRSPNYPQSNGLSERGVGITKNLITKAKDSERDVQLALLEYRNTFKAS